MKKLRFSNEYKRAAYDAKTNTLYLDNGQLKAYSPVGSGLAMLVIGGDREAISQVIASSYVDFVTRLPKGVNWVDLPVWEITMYEVNSSNINLIGYDETTQTLYVEYRGGVLYEYANVPLQWWNGLKQADSKGSWVHWFVKINDSDFPYKKTNIAYTVSSALPNKGEEHPDGYMNM